MFILFEFRILISFIVWELNVENFLLVVEWKSDTCVSKITVEIDMNNEIHAHYSSVNVSSDAFTPTFQKHNVHSRIKNSEIKTWTLGSKTLQADLKKKKRFAEDITDDNNYQEHDSSSLVS